MKTSEMKRTEIGKNYFNGEGAYQKEYDELWDEMVPASGMAKTLRGELIRAVGRLTHEYFNNGNINAAEQHFKAVETPCCSCHGTGAVEDVDEEGNPIEVDCPDCGGNGCYTEEEELEPTIKPMYANFIRLIEENVPGIEGTMEMVADVIYGSHSTSSLQCLFSSTSVGYYSEMADKVVFHVLNSGDSELPEWYLADMAD